MPVNKAKTSNVQTMLRAIINGQSSMKAELLGEFKKVNKKIEDLDQKIDGVELRLTKRIDTLGEDIARLEDDAPTWKAHDKLEKRVTKIEKKLAFS